MGVLAYVGLPGSGKSYAVVVNQVLPALRAGRVVVTNVPLDETAIRREIQTGEIRAFPLDAVAQNPDSIEEHAPRGCVLVVDEVWKLWPAGITAKNVPLAFRSFLAEHRHRVDADRQATQVVLVAQDLGMVSAFVRQLVAYTYLHTNLGHLGAGGSYRVRVFQGAVTGQNPPKGSEVNALLGRYDSRYFPMYRSHTQSDAPESGANEKAVDRRGSVWRNPKVWLGFGAVVLFVAIGVPYAMRSISKPKLAHVGLKTQKLFAGPAEVPPGKAPVVAGGVGSPAVEQPSVPSSSQAVRWRIAAVIGFDGRPATKHVVVTDNVRSQTIPYVGFCVANAGGWDECQFDGQTVTQWSAPPPVTTQAVLSASAVGVPVSDQGGTGVVGPVVPSTVENVSARQPVLASLPTPRY